MTITSKYGLYETEILNGEYDCIVSFLCNSSESRVVMYFTHSGDYCTVEIASPWSETIIFETVNKVDAVVLFNWYKNEIKNR